jgi:hypothetical protein
MILPLKWCRVGGCRNKTRNAGGWCDEHLKKNPTVDYARQRGKDEVNRLYRRTMWVRMRSAMLMRNPICTRLSNGAQCQNHSVLVHHLTSPREKPELFVEPRNLVCLCQQCHCNDEGTPWWKPGVDYIENVFQFATFGGV